MKSAVLLPLILAPIIGSAQDQPLTLLQALTHARANRPTLVAAIKRVESAKLTRRALGAFPSTRLSLGYSDPLEVGGTDDDLLLSQPLDLFGRSSAGRASGDALVAKAEAEYRGVIAELQFDVLNQFAEAAAAKALLDSAKQSEAVALRLKDAISTLVQEGKLPGVQRQRVEIELERAKLTKAQRAAELHAAVKRLSGLIGVAVSEGQIGEFGPIAVPKSGGEFVAMRPDILMLLADKRSAEADARIAGISSLPELEIQGRRTAWQETERRYGIRVQLSIPLFDFGKSRSERSAALKGVQALEKAIADARKVAEAELEAAQVELDAANEQIDRFQEIDKATHTLVERSQIGFTEKAITLIDLLEATRALREVEEGMAEARLRLAKSQAAFLKASGQLLEVVQ